MKKIKIESIMKIILLFTEFAIIKMKTNSKSQLTPQVRVTTNMYRKKNLLMISVQLKTSKMEMYAESFENVYS